MAALVRWSAARLLAMPGMRMPWGERVVDLEQTMLSILLAYSRLWRGSTTFWASGWLTTRGWDCVVGQSQSDAWPGSRYCL